MGGTLPPRRPALEPGEARATHGLLEHLLVRLVRVNPLLQIGAELVAVHGGEDLADVLAVGGITAGALARIRAERLMHDGVDGVERDLREARVVTDVLRVDDLLRRDHHLLRRHRRIDVADAGAEDSRIAVDVRLMHVDERDVGVRAGTMTVGSPVYGSSISFAAECGKFGRLPPSERICTKERPMAPARTRFVMTTLLYSQIFRRPSRTARFKPGPPMKNPMSARSTQPASTRNATATQVNLPQAQRRRFF